MILAATEMCCDIAPSNEATAQLGLQIYRALLSKGCKEHRAQMYEKSVQYVEEYSSTDSSESEEEGSEDDEDDTGMEEASSGDYDGDVDDRDVDNCDVDDRDDDDISDENDSDEEQDCSDLADDVSGMEDE
jgi:hypothetical protein